jgi:hypothetical protein
MALSRPLVKRTRTTKDGQIRIKDVPTLRKIRLLTETEISAPTSITTTLSATKLRLSGLTSGGRLRNHRLCGSDLPVRRAPGIATVTAAPAGNFAGRFCSGLRATLASRSDSHEPPSA